ncbi:MAG: hypothetical protein A4E62_02038 [Syntrophorhabdus sp. PtaU1.Bin002]|nr:MAG: hypothetical protein A4E62_02038 [Syntrophorhabdus sp. PtaU1.Bin002]
MVVEGPFRALHLSVSRGREMKKYYLVFVVIGVGFLAFSCASTGYNTQKGAAIGGAIGAIMGQAIGGNTTGTLVGLASGALVGAIAGNAVDQDETNRRLEGGGYQGNPQIATAPPEDYPQAVPPEQPPGRWVEVPGQWAGGRWVPSHRVWVPVNP